MRRRPASAAILPLLAVAGSIATGACNDDASTTSTSASSSSGESASSTGGGGTGGAGGEAVCGADVTADALDAGTWDTRFTISGFLDHDGIAPRVNDFAAEPDGSLLATGRFRSFEGATVTPLMRWKNGQWAPARTSWELPLPPDGFEAVSVAPTGELALATAAASFPGAPKSGEIWVDAGTGLQSIGAFDGQVRSIAWFDGKLWVAGLFSMQGAPAAENLAVWDGAQWSAPAGGAADGPVYELFVDGSTIFAGGAFTTVGGAPALNVASYDGATWTPYDFAGALAIYAIARTSGGTLYAGGAIGALEDAGGLAEWDGAAWDVVGGGLAQFQTRGVVSDIAVHGDVVDVTGCFSDAGGLDGDPGAIHSRSFARWDGSAWQSLDDGTKPLIGGWFSPGVCGDEDPSAIWDVDQQRIAYDGARLVAGGMIPGAAGVLSQSIVAHDGAGWVAQGASGLGFGGSLERFAVGGPGCDLYATGTFSHVAGAPATGRVVHFNGAGWDELSAPISGDAWCPALVGGPSGEIAMGCIGSDADGQPLGLVLVRKDDAMVPLDLPGLGVVLSLAYAPSGALFVGGVDASGNGFVARLDGSALTPIPGAFDGSPNQIDVVSDTDVVVGGSFTHVGAVAAANVAHWDGASWTSLAGGVPGQVTALARDGGHVYVSTYDTGNGAYLLGDFDGTSWKELAGPAAGVTPKPEFNFNRIVPVKGGLVVAGSAVLDDASGRGVLVYRDGKLTALGGGVGAIGISDVAVTGDAVWVAGQIAQAGPEADPVATIGVARLALPPADP